MGSSDGHALMCAFSPPSLNNFSRYGHQARVWEGFGGDGVGRGGVHTHWCHQWPVDATSASTSTSLAGPQPAPPGDVSSGRNWMEWRGEEVFFSRKVYSEVYIVKFQENPIPHTLMASFFVFIGVWFAILEIYVFTFEVSVKFGNWSNIVYNICYCHNKKTYI